MSLRICNRGLSVNGGYARLFRTSRPASVYLFFALIIFWLTYNNLQGLVLLNRSEVETSNHAELLFSPFENESSLRSSQSQFMEINHNGINQTNGKAFKGSSTNSSDLIQEFHIYWLASAERDELRTRQRNRMENAFRTFRLNYNKALTVQAEEVVTRIPWWTVQQVMDIFTPTDKTTPRLILNNNITLKSREQKPKRPVEYSYEEAAELLTHLTALSKAYQAGYEQVLIVQDSAILSQDFFDNWQAYASLAPKDWTVLQWATNNLASMEQSLPLPEPWISWLPDLWGTHAYLINRKGLAAICKRLVTTRKVKKGATLRFFNLDDKYKQIFLADELLFSVHNQIAYTSTFPWIVSDDIRESIDWKTPFGAPFASSPPNLSLPDLSYVPTRNESLLVFMNIRFATSKQMKLEMERTLTDLEVVCAIHRHSKCHWIIQGVFTQDYLLERFRETCEEQLPSNVIEFNVTVGSARFNKFGLLAHHLSKMSQYDLVLLKDNDQRLAGFPWASFLKQKGNALVAGPLRQAPDESFVRISVWEKSQHYKLHDAQGWKKRNFAPWATSLFVSAKPIDVAFLEMYFNVFDGPYAEWFFSQVLKKNFTDQDSCWGPDFLWCPAAKEYGNSTGQGDRMGCALVPFVSVHEDTRQIIKDGETFNDRGYAAVEHLRLSNPAFERWYGITYKYSRGVIAWRQLDAIAKQCRKLLRGRVLLKATDPIDFQTCINAGMARKTII